MSVPANRVLMVDIALRKSMVLHANVDVDSWEWHVRLVSLPYKVKMPYADFILHVNYFLLPWKILKEISRWSMLIDN